MPAKNYREHELAADVLEWQREVKNGHSPYREDHRIRWVSGDYEITKEGDKRYWLRFQKNPLGMGPRLIDAKQAAERHAAEARGSRVPLTPRGRHDQPDVSAM